MKKTLLLLLSLLMLVGCSTPAGIKCKTITLSEGGSTFYTDGYTYTDQIIYRYVDNMGHYIYTNAQVRYNDNYSGNSGNASIKVYTDRTNSGAYVYNFDKELGHVKYTHNVYLDLKKRTIEIVNKYEKEDDYRYNSTIEDRANNNAAYEAISKEFYMVDSYTYSSKEVVVYKEDVKNNREAHSYKIYGTSATVSYTILDD